MEGKEDLQSSGVMKGDEVPDTYRVASRSENPVQFGESTTPVLPFSESTTLVVAVAPVAVLAPPVAAQPPAMAATPATPVSGATPGAELKKKRGRPRKYGPDGKPAVALSPMPISASIPLTGDYSTWKHNRGRPIDSYKKKHKLEFESPGERVAYSVGANFTPHVITVNAGELDAYPTDIQITFESRIDFVKKYQAKGPQDVTMKIISFSQQGSRAICILAANGAISNVTLRQPNSSGGTLTYEGRFEILSLSGSFMPTDSGGTKSRTGGMSVSLAGPDGRVLGGGIAGLLVAAGPVQVVIGSFLPGHQQEQKPKKQKFELATAFSPVPANHISGEGTDGVYSGTKPNLTPASYLGNNLGSGNSFHGSKVFGAENNVSLPGESKDLSPTKCMVSC